MVNLFFFSPMKNRERISGYCYYHYFFLSLRKEAKKCAHIPVSKPSRIEYIPKSPITYHVPPLRLLLPPPLHPHLELLIHTGLSPPRRNLRARHNPLHRIAHNPPSSLHQSLRNRGRPRMYLHLPSLRRRQRRQFRLPNRIPDAARGG